MYGALLICYLSCILRKTMSWKTTFGGARQIPHKRATLGKEKWWASSGHAVTDESAGNAAFSSPSAPQAGTIRLGFTTSGQNETEESQRMVSILPRIGDTQARRNEAGWFVHRILAGH